MMEFNNPFHFDFAEAVVLEELHAVALGNVTTGEPGTDAKVTLRREDDTFVFDFVIPRGKTGEAGRDSAGIQRIEMSASQSTVDLLPNILYVFPEMQALSITLGGEIDHDTVQEYRFRFTSGATATTLTLPDSVLGDITVDANRVYEVSILDGYLISQSWEVT